MQQIGDARIANLGQVLGQIDRTASAAEFQAEP